MLTLSVPIPLNNVVQLTRIGTLILIDFLQQIQLALFHLPHKLLLLLLLKLFKVLLRYLVLLPLLLLPLQYPQQLFLVMALELIEGLLKLEVLSLALLVQVEDLAVHVLSLSGVHY